VETILVLVVDTRFFYFQQKFDYYWRWWRNEMWFGTMYKPVLLEVRIPKEIPKPIRAMEMVFTALHGAIYNDPDWWEKYVSGEPQTGLSFEIASIDGQIHFYIRIHSDYREQAEAAIYSQFPDAEIEAVPDYTKQIPMDIPNREWDLFGWDWKMQNLLISPYLLMLTTKKKIRMLKKKKKLMFLLL